MKARTTKFTNPCALLVVLVAIALLPACTYNVASAPSYESFGVSRLNDFPRERRYQNLGMHAWGFYRPSFSEPSLADVWEALSEKVRAIGGNACIVRYEKVGNISARTLEVTCEVLKVEIANKALQPGK